MNCEYLAYKPKEVTPGIWLPEDGIDYHSKYTSVKKYNPDGLLFYEIKNGYEEKTVFMDLLPTAKLMHHMFSYLEKKIMYHYEKGGILKKTTFISYSDNFEVEHTEKNFFYENDSTICLHYLYDKPSYYDKTTLLKDKKIVEYWNADKRPYLRYEYHYNNDKLMTLVEFELPSNRIKQFWEHKYDSNGNCIEMQRFNFKKEPEHCWEYFFDEYNNCIKEQMVFGTSKRLVEDIDFIHEYKVNQFHTIYYFDWKYSNSYDEVKGVANVKFEIHKRKGVEEYDQAVVAITDSKGLNLLYKGNLVHYKNELLFHYNFKKAIDNQK